MKHSHRDSPLIHPPVLFPCYLQCKPTAYHVVNVLEDAIHLLTKKGHSLFRLLACLCLPINQLGDRQEIVCAEFQSLNKRE